MVDSDTSYPTMIDAPRIYPRLHGFRREGKMLFTISISSDNGVALELQEMTEEEIDAFIVDIKEQVYLLINHPFFNNSSPTTKTEIEI